MVRQNSMVKQDSFGALVRRCRRDAELTQEALAERAGLSARVIRMIETGSGHRPRQDTVRLLLDALAVPADEQSAFLRAAAGQAAGERDAAGTERATQALMIGGYLGALPSGPLVAREDVLAPLLAALEAVQAGS